MQIDIAPLGLYAEVCCPACYYRARVHSQLGNFRLDSILGIGGMSVVYRAFDVTLHRHIALKVLNDTFRDNPERIERFENESAMMARVRHENVTSVYSAGRAYGQFYIAMELVEGENLEHMVSPEAPLDPAYALHIISDVVHGLDAAQSAGLLHRDMKPGNILITRTGQAKVIDFGLALDSHQDNTEEIIWATPYYVAPETLQCSPEDVRTDIYALGMTLRFLLTGIEFFEGDVSSVTSLLISKRKQRSIAKQAPHLERSLCELVDHMTAFSPQKRPANYADLLEEIEEVQHLLAQQQDSPGFHLQHHLGAIAAVALSIVIGLFLALTVFSTHRVEEQTYVKLETISCAMPESQTLDRALKYVNSGEYDAAVAYLMTQAERTKEPVYGAWCAQLARAIAQHVCLSEANAEEKAYDLLTKNLANASDVSPDTQEALEFIKSVVELYSPTVDEWKQRTCRWDGLDRADLIRRKEELQKSSMCPPALELMLWYGLAEQALWIEDYALVDTCLEEMRDIVPDLQEYAGLAPLYADARLKLQALNFVRMEGDRGRALAEMREHHLDEAEAILSKLLQTPGLKGMLRVLVEVQHEVCIVGKAMISGVIARHFPEEYRPGMSVNDMVKLVRTKMPDTFPKNFDEEVRIVAMMLEEDTSAVFKRIDAYAKSHRDGSRPFAMIAADWKARWTSINDVWKGRNFRPKDALTDKPTRDELQTVVERCKRFAYVLVQPGQSLGFLNQPKNISAGSFTYLPLEDAMLLQRNGVVRIVGSPDKERGDMQVIAILGLKTMRHTDHEWIKQGEVRPCLAREAQFFIESGNAVEVHSVEDVLRYMNLISPNPGDPMLRREVVY